MICELIKDFVIPKGGYFEDVEGEIYLEGFKENGIEVAKLTYWRKITPIKSPEFARILERNVRIGIYMGEFDKSIYSLADKVKKSLILIDKKVHSFGYIPTNIMKKVLVGWEVIKNEVVEK